MFNLTIAQEERVQELHRNSIVIDTHCDTLLGVVGKRYSLAEERSTGHIDLPRLKRGGVSCQFFAVYIEPPFKPDRSLKRALQMIDSLYEDLPKANGEMEIAYSAADIERIVAQDKVAAVIAIEGGEAMEGDLGVLRMLYRLGVRAVGLTWNQRNQIADGVGEIRSKGGLTNFGVAVIQEMNRLGMIVDVSHITKPGFWDVIETTRDPIIASHSNAEVICNHARNLDDDQIKALAKNGGVMGMNFCPPFVKADGQATVMDMLDHIDHIVTLVGPDHVGLGSDFDGIGSTPIGLENATQMINITRGLVSRGYDDDSIKKILGGNHLRVIRQVLK